MNKVWMITGAGRGLGRAFASEAVKNGDKVIAAVRKLDENDELMKNEAVLPVIMDVTKRDEVEAAVKKGLDKFGRIDVLVNNAGFGFVGAFEEISEEELRFQMDTNFFGMTHVIRAALPAMREQKEGMILNLSSMAGAMGFAGFSAYCASKYAVVGLSDALSKELAPFGIQVASVLPGPFRTDFNDRSSMKMPKNPISAYDGTPAHGVEKSASENNHTQPGNPPAAAAFLYGLVESGKLPLRILIGTTCCTNVRNFFGECIDEIDSYMEESVKTDF